MNNFEPIVWPARGCICKQTTHNSHQPLINTTNHGLRTKNLFGGTNVRRKLELSTGVRGHASPQNFEKRDR